MQKACKNCHLITSEGACPACKGQDFADKWRGFVIIINPEISDVAKKMGVSLPGRYALKLL